MKKVTQISALLLSILIILGTLPVISLAETAVSLENFKKVRSFEDADFADVKPEDSFYEDVKNAYELGLMDGIGETSFGAEEYITIGEVMAVSARIHSIYFTGEANFDRNSPYIVHEEYCKTHYIIDVSDHYDLNAVATRAQFVTILQYSLPDRVVSTERVLREINYVPANSIPDVNMMDQCSIAVYRMYRAGVIVGEDTDGRFLPDSSYKRCEAAGIFARMAIPLLRKTVHFENIYVNMTEEIPTYTDDLKCGQFFYIYSKYFLNDHGPLLYTDIPDNVHQYRVAADGTPYLVEPTVIFDETDKDRYIKYCDDYYDILFIDLYYRLNNGPTYFANYYTSYCRPVHWAFPYLDSIIDTIGNYSEKNNKSLFSRRRYYDELEKLITRADVTLLVRELLISRGLSLTSPAITVDVSAVSKEDDKLYSAICELTECGLFNGDCSFYNGTDEQFRPDDPVTLKEAEQLLQKVDTMVF